MPCERTSQPLSANCFLCWDRWRMHWSIRLLHGYRWWNKRRRGKHRSNSRLGGRIGHALITGGSSGIGLELAKIAVRAGHNVSIIARRPLALKQAADLLVPLLAGGAGVHTISADVARRGDAENAVREAIAKFGTPSHLITSAGNVIPGYFHELPAEAFEQM